jgi:AraC family transcriptional regulator
MMPKIISVKEKNLAGLRAQISLLEHKTGELWRLFSPRIKEIDYRINDQKISLEIYPNNYYKAFKANNSFKKWTTVEVTNFEKIPEDLHTFILESALYAVFHYKGSSINNATYHYVFSN